ncbi:MAG TPA: Co2+/Mg2+ efflux protein ApaG [Bacteroidetes bacterium]|nr:Co2+/Mg2+ efflux protein ApaG [Bacteroidota bacterium]
METLITQGIRISVEPRYLPKESKPSQHSYVYAYHITIDNLGPDTVQLLRRHWYIQESNGILREVEGPGVVGRQPVLEPRQRHQYTSWCPLMTDMGKMYGTFKMQNLRTKAFFEVVVPEFKMVAPFKLN